MKAMESKTFSYFLPFFSTFFLFTARDHSRDTNKSVKLLLLSTLHKEIVHPARYHLTSELVFELNVYAEPNRKDFEKREYNSEIQTSTTSY